MIDVCVAAPARVIAIAPPHGVSIPATVVLDGVERPVDLAMVPEVGVGDYVIVHSGYAIAALTSPEARERLQLLQRGRAERSR